MTARNLAAQYAFNRQGFSLLELLMTMAIVGISLGMAVPGLTGLIRDNRMSAVLNDFVTDLNLARSEAIKRGSRITLCASRDQQHCTDNGDWSQGWIVFADPDDNGRRDSTETLLRIHPAIVDKHTSFIGNRNLRHSISYVGSGFSRRPSGAPQNGTLVLCDRRGFEAHARAIVLNHTGRPSSMPASESGVRNCNATG